MEKKQNAFLRRILYTAVVLLVVLILWYLCFLFVGDTMRIVPPHQAFAHLGVMAMEASFWKKIGSLLLPVLCGWLLGCLVGITLSFAEKDTPFGVFLGWIRSVSSILPYFPIILAASFGFYGNGFLFVLLATFLASVGGLRKHTLKGHETLNEDLLLMANCNASYRDVLIYLRLPHLVPFVRNGMIVSWDKAFGIGLLASFLADENGTVGGALQESVSSLLTEKVYAWMIALVLLGAFLRQLLSFALGKLRFSPHISATDQFARNGHSFPIVFDRISKRYGEKVVLDRYSYVFSNGKITSICGASGSGKTTVLRIASAILQDDDNRFAFPPTAPGLIFKEPCLIPNLTVRENLIFANRACNAEKILKSLALTKQADLYPEDLDLPTQKRVAIARAIAFGGGIGVFDEPFEGMDDDTKALSAAALFGAYRGKTVLFATSNEEDAARFGDDTVKLS